ncbi:MAG: ketoacyl-ACP synthase III [Acidobacteriia bacterium]|nr:ketoacyl-ACP synthase III [Terriglobia bacterium]
MTNHSIRAKITGLGTYVPERLLTNADLEKMVDTNDQWIMERVGIRERHIVEKGTATSDLGAKAVECLMRHTHITPDDIECIVVGTVTPDMFFPSTACLIQNKIGAHHTWGFDVSGACCGFLYALSAGAQFVCSGVHKKVVVVGADVMSSIIDYKDRNTCVLFGDGAGAVLVEPAEEGEAFGILDFVHEVDGSGGQFLYMPGGGSWNPSSHETVDKNMHVVHQDGKAVFKYAVRKMYEVSETLLKRNNLKLDDIKLLVPHQANLRIIQATADRLGLPPERVVLNIDRFGNTTAATIPLGMADAVADGRLKKGDLILLISVGAGFTVGGILIRWAY